MEYSLDATYAYRATLYFSMVSDDFMIALSINPEYIIAAPSVPLRPYIGHYWLSLNNTDTHHVAVPDGSVDLVVEVGESSMQRWLYGSTTTRTEIDLNTRCHYIGIRFQPGQSRHFIDATARELTDDHAEAEPLMRSSMDGVFDTLAPERVVSRLNQVLERYLARRQPSVGFIDQAIEQITMAQGNVRIETLAADYGRSRRQFERVFLETVGVTPKFFCLITRYRRAAGLITAPSGLSLADAAAETGYADQSHMTHDFKKLTGLSPTQFIRDVAILQDWV